MYILQPSVNTGVAYCYNAEIENCKTKLLLFLLCVFDRMAHMTFQSLSTSVQMNFII